MAIQFDLPGAAPADGAVLGQRHGVSVVAHYGSVAAEMAVCRKAAGLVDRRDLARIDVTGAAPWIDHALARVLGAPAPEPGRAARAADIWCCRVATDHAVLVGPASALARWRNVLRSAVVAGDRIAYGAADGASVFASLVGPRAARVLDAFGLPGSLPPGGVAAPPGPVGLLVREADDAFLLGFEAAHAPAVRSALTLAGAPFGLSRVGSDALERLRIARPL